MLIIIIPVYNDWASLNKLLQLIDVTIAIKIFTRVLIIDDCSRVKSDFKKKKLKKIKDIEILQLNKNLGSQKAITIGLNHLKKNKKFFYAVIMDGDGEDNPVEIEKMLNISKKNKNSVVVSCRSGRNESIFIQFCYKIHLFICFFFTTYWVNFGNFSCFYSKNLNKILSNNKIWYAYSSGILKNAKIIRTYSRRNNRFFGETKMSFFNYLEHSTRVISNFSNRVFLSTSIYLFLVFKLLNEIFFVTTLVLLLFNIIICYVLLRHKNHHTNYNQFISTSKFQSD